jgi:putative ATPase
VALDATEVYERLGSPEGELALAEAVVYLAVAPKSNAVYSAWKAARAFVKADGTRPVPDRLRNAPTRLMKQLGHGAGYRYAHDEADGFAAGERYLPDGMPETRFYVPPATRTYRVVGTTKRPESGFLAGASVRHAPL